MRHFGKLGQAVRSAEHRLFPCCGLERVGAATPIFTYGFTFERVHIPTLCGTQDGGQGLIQTSETVMV